MRIVRPAVFAPLAVAVALCTGTGIAGAAPTTTPAAYHYVGQYFTDDMCQTGGKEGIAEGKWLTYVCQPQQIGFDLYWNLYVSP